MRQGLERVFRLCVAGAAMILPLWGYSDGPEPFKTGGPFPNESICAVAGCHASPTRVNAGQGKVTITVSPYKPGQTQRITVNVSDPATTQRRWGFQLTVRLANALTTSAGTFSCQVGPGQNRCLTPDGNSQVICGNPARPNDPLTFAPCVGARIPFAEHTLAGTRNDTTGGVDFQIDWTPPATDVGEIIFAAAGNAANGNLDADAGDNIYTTNCKVSVTAGCGAAAPAITSGGVAGAGQGVTAIATNALISIYGQNLAPDGTFRPVSSTDLVSGKLPTSLAGVCVQVNSQPAAMFFVSPTQINVQAPTLNGTGNMPVQVIANCGAPSQSISNPQDVMVQTASPEFFLFTSASGKGPVAAANAVTGALIGAPGLIPGATFAPAKPGDFVALYGTGFGATNPAFQSGVLPDTIAATAAKVTVSVNGLTLADSDVLYAGVAPNFAGLYQINIQVPASAPDGDLPVQATISGVSTPAGAFITVKK